MESPVEPLIGTARRPRDGQSADAGERDWLADLAEAGDRRDDAVADLHRLLRRIAGREAVRRAGTHGLHGPELDDLADQAADDALVSVLRRLPDFAGRSRFTTWAAKFAILEIAQKIGRHQWQRLSPAPDPARWEDLPAHLATSPEQVVEASELLAAIREIVEHDLTARQRLVFEALVVSGVPLDVLTVELGSTRNALYKSMFDIRTKLRDRLVARGLVGPEEVTR